MKTVEEVLAASKEVYEIDGAIDAFVEFIEGLDIEDQLKIEILCRFNSALCNAEAKAIAETIAAISGMDVDKLSSDTTEFYEKWLLKNSIKAKTAALEKESGIPTT